MKGGNSAFCIPSATLLLIGGLNWGLQGLGMLVGRNLNLVSLLLGKWPVAEAIVYILVGLAACKVLAFVAMGKDCCGSCESK